MTRILITGNCVRYDIAAQLALWLPTARIITADVGMHHTPAENTPLAGLLAESDLLITMSSREETEQIAASFPKNKLSICRIPMIGFAAFHPDICFAVNAETGIATQQVFNSAIGGWAYLQGMQASEAATLFNAQNYQALGYFNAWNRSVTYLRDAFARSDLAPDFAAFFYAVKRDGRFMQTFNHPTPRAITVLCTLICKYCGLQPVSNEPISRGSSPASRLVWPVYPEIAQALGVAGVVIPGR